uniref:SEC7 domain-containing protein n=1 Tax=Trichobilharzia regenti TaxID=157069 RepID=A0AA85K1H1_TRIRE|nr:unnamed protein product [Trichobilharzia regenti]
MASTSHFNNSNSQQVNLSECCNKTGDPTSLWCDESLENSGNILDHCICYPSTPSSFSTTSGSTSYSRDLYTTSRLRSRSEEKTHKSEFPCDISINNKRLTSVQLVCNSCSCPETKGSVHLLTEQNGILEKSHSTSRQGDNCKQKERLCNKSYSLFCCNEDSDSVPPAMALINVNRLSTRNLNLINLNNKNDNTIAYNNNNNENNDNNKNNTSNADLQISHAKKTKSLLRNSRKSLPAIHFDYDLEVSHSSGTSSLSDAAVGVDEQDFYLQTDKLLTVFSNGSHSHNIQFGQTGASARDSGLSSHSSNSVNYSPNSTQLSSKAVNTATCQLNLSPTSLPTPLPPPVPEHAPHSQAKIALARRKEGGISNATSITSVPQDNDTSKCTCFKNVTNKAIVNKITGTTIRLHSHGNEARTRLEPKDYKFNGEPKEQTLKSSLSPIWKRKLSNSTPKLKGLLTEKQPTRTTTITTTTTNITTPSDIHYMQFIRMNGEEEEKREKNVKPNPQYEENSHHSNNIEQSSIHAYPPSNNSSNTQQQQQQNQPPACILCTVNWQFYLSQPSNLLYSIIDNSDDNTNSDKKAIYSNESNAWYFLSHADFLKSTIHLVKPEQCYNCRRHIYAVGINLFNRNPLRGLKFLAKHKFLKLSSSEEISEFIYNNPDLCRSKIGAFLGLPPSEEINPTEVTMLLLKTLNMSNLEVDEALRLVVNRFGMPVESQEIDRLLQCISEYYHTVRWPSSPITSINISSSSNHHQSKQTVTPPITVDQLSLIFYAILLLQTSLHNANAAKSSLGKQNVNQFIKNVHDLLMSSSTNEADNDDNHDDNDDRQRKSVVNECNSNGVEARQLFSNRILTEIYHRIKARPLLTGADQTDTVRRISKAMGNLNQVKILPHRSTTNIFELVDTHRRLVCYCTVIHIIQNQPPEKETRALRHLFVFNDLVILAKDASSSSSSTSSSSSSSKHQSGRKSIFDKSKHRQISTDNVLFSRHKCNDEFLQPPLDLLINSFDDKPQQQMNNLESSAFICAQPTVHCLPYTRRSRSKNDINTHKAAASNFNSHSSTRLTALYAISLVQCKIRPFKTDGK